MNKKFIIGIGIAIALNLAISIVGLVGVNQLSQLVNQTSFGATGTRLTHGISTDSTSPNSGEVRTTDLIVTDEATLGDDTVKWEEITMAAGTNEGYFTCPSATSTIDRAEFIIPQDGVASTTYAIQVFATTSTSVHNNYDFTTLTPPYKDTLLPKFTFATSTTATTTSIGGYSAFGDSPLQDWGAFECGPSENLMMHMVVWGAGNWGTNLQAGSSYFEPASSTARGFNPMLKIRYHR